MPVWSVTVTVLTIRRIRGTYMGVPIGGSGQQGTGGGADTESREASRPSHIPLSLTSQRTRGGRRVFFKSPQSQYLLFFGEKALVKRHIIAAVQWGEGRKEGRKPHE